MAEPTAANKAAEAKPAEPHVASLPWSVLDVVDVIASQRRSLGGPQAVRDDYGRHARRGNAFVERGLVTRE
ncbi:MAG: hypothetical protein AAGA56_15700 [Myxococcota bacterium]